MADGRREGIPRSWPLAGGPSWVSGHDAGLRAVAAGRGGGVLSLASDLAMGQPLEHGMRTAALGVRTAAAMGLSEQDRVCSTRGCWILPGAAESEIDT